MNRNILLAVFAVGMASAAFTPQAGAEGGSDIPREKLGMIPGTMAHLKDVKLTAVPKLPDYVVNNDDDKKWDHETDHPIILYNQLDVLMEYPPLR